MAPGVARLSGFGRNGAGENLNAATAIILSVIEQIAIDSERNFCPLI